MIIQSIKPSNLIEHMKRANRPTGSYLDSDEHEILLIEGWLVTAVGDVAAWGVAHEELVQVTACHELEQHRHRFCRQAHTQQAHNVWMSQLRHQVHLLHNKRIFVFS